MVCADVLSRGWLFATPWTVACQAPLVMELSRQEYWNGLPFPTPTWFVLNRFHVWVRSLSLSDLFHLAKYPKVCCKWQDFILFYGWIIFCLYVYIYTYIYTHTYTHIHTHTQIHTTFSLSVHLSVPSSYFRISAVVNNAAVCSERWCADTFLS